MRIITALGREFECDSVGILKNPPRLYLHLSKTNIGEVVAVFSDNAQLPIAGYPDFDAVQSISEPGPSRVKVSLKKSKK